MTGSTPIDPALLPLLSRLYLPKLDPPPGTVFEYLIARFPRIPPQTWRDRLARRTVTFENGDHVMMESGYQHGRTIIYQREVPLEPESWKAETILFRDDQILVADKPHGMVVSPAGDHLERSLLLRLQRQTGLTDLAPMHRLDRDTAGLVLFSVLRATRGRYHQLFPEGRIDKEYLAVGRVGNRESRTEWRIESRIEQGSPWFRQRIVEGTVNAVTEIELLDTRGPVGLFRIRPITGKQHQIRLHMASIHCPILGDPLYPTMTDRNLRELPLQLLARRLFFVDPVQGVGRTFVSGRRLHW
jgi:tRNA pseudouridine32 synthase/23S rRNA pseudouridine746 synthase